jgi:hypothetical protein
MSSCWEVGWGNEDIGWGIWHATPLNRNMEPDGTGWNRNRIGFHAMEQAAAAPKGAKFRVPAELGHSHFQNQRGNTMSEPTKAPEFIHVERLLEAPVIYFDAVPTAGFRGPVLSVTLALIVGDMVSQTNTENHMLAAGAAEQLRDVLGKALLAAQPTPGPAN